MFRRLTRTQLTVDIVVPAALALVFIWPSIALLGLTPAEPLAFLGFCVALVFRRLSPGLSLAIAWAVALLEMLARIDAPGPSNLLILGVLFATGAHGGPVVRWLGFASSFVGAACVAVYIQIIPMLSNGLPGVGDAARYLLVAGFLFGAALAGFLLSWTAGLLMTIGLRGRASRAAAAAASYEVIAEQERTRIARDMHDVVAHSLAVVIAQADGARYLRKSDPEAVDEALVTIASTSREALADVRVLLAQLRHKQGDAPQPAIADLDRLYEQLRASGLTIEIDGSGEALAVPTPTQLAIYRIVQESLTNALRHGDPGEPVLLRFDWAPGGLHLSIASALKPNGSPSGTPGHGLAGMAERASLVGGTLGAGAEGTRFVVRAWLPALATTGPVAAVLPMASSPAAHP
ncbi:sensor histidine kinase, partial [Schumannella sp. 10F1B-5-1]|uniref:sensor histidine kinase n=1 Tax=Schumannella sp. 10F1B-5-1 TaxID=2590780 RepID=UPI00112FF44B